MSRIYNFIEAQINDILRLAVTNDQGDIDWSLNRWLSPSNVKLVIALISSLCYLLILSMAGIYLWNHGIHAMAPGIVRPFGNGSYQQFQNQYQQLFITLFAMVMFF